MRPHFLLALVPIVVASMGCGRALTATSIKRDGSATRVVTIKTPLKNPMGQEEKDNVPEKLFALPAASSGVKLQNSVEEENRVLKFSRQVAAGNPGLEDIVLLDPKKKPLATSTLLIRKLPNGNLEYTETLRWKGDRAKMDATEFARARSEVKQCLPARHQTTEKIDDVTKKLGAALTQMLFGPPEPNFALLLSNPDLAERKIITILYARFEQALKESLPDLSAEERRQTTATLVRAMKSSSMLNQNSAQKVSAKAQDKESGMSEMMSFLYEIDFPGELVSTNGLVEPFSGKVYWSLYPVAASYGDVVLKAVIKP